MMNSSNPESYVPSMMSFVGLEGSSQSNPQHLWDWETNTTQNPNTHPLFLSNTQFLDCPPPNFLPMSNFPLYSPPVPEYQTGLVKREDQEHGVGRIGLNLGHRTYFSSGDGVAIDRLFRRSRGLYPVAHQIPRCIADECKADLSAAKHYHRRHKVCEFHSKASVVVAGGIQQRFCQQCSRFHVLAEFDEAKRSCRKRLADHNRRRRKPQLPPTTTTTTDHSPTPKDPTTSSSQKIKPTPKNTKETCNKSKTNSKATTTATVSASTICTGNTNIEEQQGYQIKTTHLRNGPSLSLGGVEKRNMGSQSLYQGSYAAMSVEKISSQQQQQEEEEQKYQQQHHHFPSPSSSSNTFFHHHNLFCSQSTGAGSDQTHHHHTNLLHLGQAMFEVDFI